MPQEENTSINISHLLLLLQVHSCGEASVKGRGHSFHVMANGGQVGEVTGPPRCISETIV